MSAAEGTAWPIVEGASASSYFLAFIWSVLLWSGPAFADITYVYDELGRLVAVIDPSSDTAVYSLRRGRQPAEYRPLPILDSVDHRLPAEIRTSGDDRHHSGHGIQHDPGEQHCHLQRCGGDSYLIDDDEHRRGPCRGAPRPGRSG